MSWKKITVQEAIKNNVGKCYSDYHGILTLTDKHVLGLNNIPLTALYIKTGDNYEQVHDADNIDLFNQTFYQLNKNFYGYNRSQYKEICKPYTLTYGIQGYDRTYGARGYTEAFSIPAGKKDFEVWVTDKPFDLVKIERQGEIKKGDKVCFGGTCVVDEVYEYPNRNNLLMKVKKTHSLNNTEKEIDIPWNQDDLYFVPYEEKTNPDNELNIFNECKNEFNLLPWVYREDTCASIQWLSIKEAARYIVELYRVVNQPNKRRLYKLQSYEIDRNTCQLQLDNLISSGFIFRISAEDREGNVLALSRGIYEKGQPKFW